MNQTEEGADKILENDRTIIRQNIVGLMLKSPDKIQKQVSKCHCLYESF